MPGSAMGFESFDSKTSEKLSLNQVGYREYEMSNERERESEKTPLRHIDAYSKSECSCLSKRYTIALLACLGFVISFGMRCNLGMARLEMTQESLQTSTSTQNLVDSSFFWGYLLTQIPGGILASLYPANRIFGAAIVITSLLNLLVPSAIGLTFSPAIYVVIHMCQGLVEGVTYPAVHGIWKFWAPPLERSRLATLTFCGSYAAVLIGMPLSGVLTRSFGWTASFYFYGMFGIMWFGFWQWLSFEKPSKHPRISASELHYIEDSLGQTQTTSTFMTTPWLKFFTSMPVYAIIVANFCRTWNFYLLVLYQARFMYEAFQMPMVQTGFLGALPFLLMTCLVPFGGLLADCLQKRGLMSTTNVRKLFSCGGFGVEALLFLVLAVCTVTKNGAVASLALIICVVCRAFAVCGYNVNHLDIAPRYASILMGMSSTAGTIAGVLVPICVDFITKDRDGNSWCYVFVMAAGVHFVGAAFYGIFCSGELQSWAEDKKRPLDDSLGARETGRAD